MKYKICFLSGTYRTLTADSFTVDERLIVFFRGGDPVLTAVLDKRSFLRAHHRRNRKLAETRLAAQVGIRRLPMRLLPLFRYGLNTPSGR